MGGLPWRGRHGEQRGEKKRAATLCLACSPDTLLSSRPNESAPHRSRPCSGCPLDGLRYLLGLVGQCRRYDLLGRRGVTESLARRGWRRSLTALRAAPSLFPAPHQPPSHRLPPIVIPTRPQAPSRPPTGTASWTCSSPSNPAAWVWRSPATTSGAVGGTPPTRPTCGREPTSRPMPARAAATTGTRTPPSGPACWVPGTGGPTPLKPSRTRRRIG